MPSAQPDTVEQVRHQRDAAERRLASLSRVIELVSSELALTPLLTRIIECAIDLIGAEMGTIGLVRERSGGPVIQTVGSVNMPMPDPPMDFPPGVGLCGTVLQTGQPVRLDRYGDLPTALAEELAEHAMVGIPIWWSHRIIGSFGIAAPPPRRFTDEDVETLTLFARHAAIAIENARLFEAEQRRVARVAAINRLGRLMVSSLHFDDLFQTAVEAISECFDFPFVVAGVIDPEDHDTLVPLAMAGRHAHACPPGTRHHIAVGLLGVAIRNRQRVLVNDVTRDPRYHPLPGVTDIRAELVLPLTAGDRLLGALNIESDRRIDEEDADAIEIIADQFGAALENARLVGGLQRALTTAQLLHQISQRMSTAMSVEEVIAAYLTRVAAGGRYTCTVSLCETDAAGQRADPRTRGWWTAEDGVRVGDRRLPYALDAFDEWLDAGQVVTIRDARADPRVSEALRRRQSDRPALALIPLMVRGQRIGQVALTSPRPHDWQEEDLQPYQVAATLLAAAIDSRQQHLLLAERGQQLAVLEERRRLARELHDSVTQSLFSMSLLAQVVPELWEIDRAEAHRSLVQVRDLTRGALAEMRALLFELRPADQPDPDLARSLQHLVTAFTRRAGLNVAVALPPTLDLPAEVAHAIFRIAQEALTNAARHARARQVRLTLTSGPVVRLTVSDDGRGFEPGRVGPGSLGLGSMRERAVGIGADMQIRSTPGAGTTITLEWSATRSQSHQQHPPTEGESHGDHPAHHRRRSHHRAPRSASGHARAAGYGGRR